MIIWIHIKERSRIQIHIKERSRIRIRIKVKSRIHYLDCDCHRQLFWMSGFNPNITTLQKRNLISSDMTPSHHSEKQNSVKINIGNERNVWFTIRVADQHHFNADPDLALYFNANQIRIQLFFQLMKICDDWSTDLQASIVSVHAPPCLNFEPFKLRNFDFNPGPAFQSIADPDP
jgi:hypothetical protein